MYEAKLPVLYKISHPDRPSLKLIDGDLWEAGDRGTLIARNKDLGNLVLALIGQMPEMELPDHFDNQEYLEDGEDWTLHLEGTCYNVDEAFQTGFAIIQQALKAKGAEDAAKNE